MWVKLAEQQFVNISNIAWVEPGDKGGINVWCVGDKQDDFTIISDPAKAKAICDRLDALDQNTAETLECC